MSPRHPVLFVSHGAPDVLLKPGASVALWQRLGSELPRPRAILVISAHWAAREPTVSTASKPDTIHDFGGFPDALYAMSYPAPGAPALAARVRELLAGAALPCAETPDRGLDHGAWIPLKAMYPQADIPVVELALQPFAGTDWHRRIGAALRPLRDEGVLILGSGNVVHNLQLFFNPPPAGPGWADPFARRILDAVRAGDHAALTRFAANDALAEQAINSAEHYLPLLYTVGAGLPGDGVAVFNDAGEPGLAMACVLLGETALAEGLV